MKLLIERNYDELDFLTEGEGYDKTYRIRGIFAQAEILNKNERIYPKNLLEEQVLDYSNTKIRNKQSVGELDHPACNFSSNFDVMTENGWVHFLNLKVGTPIMTLEPESNKIEINNIEHLINQHYKGHGFRFKGRNIDSTFTPTHRFLLEDRYGKRGYFTADEIFNNRTKFSKYKILKTGTWEGNSDDYFVIKGLPKDSKYNSDRFSYDIHADLVIETKIFAAFVGLWLSEGCLRKRGVSVFQKKEENVEHIRELLKKFPRDVREYKNKKGGFSWHINDVRLYEFFKDQKNCYEKYIPFNIKQLSPEFLEEMLFWFCLGDGRTQIHKHGIRRNVFSTSKKLIDDLQECLFKCGSSGNLTIIPIPDKEYSFAGHTIKPENKRILYQLNFSTANAIYLDERFLDITKEEHDGNVYCLTVKNSNFYMRENNKCFWTGNSPVINLKNVSHLIESLQMDGNNVIGVAKILDTPQGRIAKSLLSEGIRLGVSTRCLGAVGPNRRVNVLRFRTVDIVSDASAPDANVTAIMESKEYIINGDEIVEKAYNDLKKNLDKNGSKAVKEAFIQFIRSVK